ncbi:hypothetical protein PTKIN_Ptkin02bG0219100 [Pterospermum kingtungense]
MLGDIYGSLGFLRSGESEWTLFKDADSIRDIISFNGKLYAIDKNGRTLVVDQSLKVGFIEPVAFPTSTKFLVQSGDNLLAVEMFFLSFSDSDALPVVGFRISAASEFYWEKGNLIFYSYCLSLFPNYGGDYGPFVCV